MRGHHGCHTNILGEGFIISCVWDDGLVVTYFMRSFGGESCEKVNELSNERSGDLAFQKIVSFYGCTMGPVH